MGEQDDRDLSSRVLLWNVDVDVEGSLAAGIHKVPHLLTHRKWPRLGGIRQGVEVNLWLCSGFFGRESSHGGGDGLRGGDGLLTGLGGTGNRFPMQLDVGWQLLEHTEQAQTVAGEGCPHQSRSQREFAIAAPLQGDATS